MQEYIVASEKRIQEWCDANRVSIPDVAWVSIHSELKTMFEMGRIQASTEAYNARCETLQKGNSSVQLKPKRIRRVIDQLRKKYPGKWVWEGPDIPYRWRSETMTVTAYSVAAPTWPEDDSTFATEFRDQDGNVIILDQSYRTYRV